MFYQSRAIKEPISKNVCQRIAVYLLSVTFVINSVQIANFQNIRNVAKAVTDADWDFIIVVFPTGDQSGALWFYEIEFFSFHF